MPASTIYGTHTWTLAQLKDCLSRYRDFCYEKKDGRKTVLTLEWESLYWQNITIVLRSPPHCEVLRMFYGAMSQQVPIWIGFSEFFAGCQFIEYAMLELNRWYYSKSI